jgi:hypothetical protein
MSNWTLTVRIGTMLRPEPSLEDIAYTQGWNDAIEAAAKVASDHYPSIIRCKDTGNVEHVRMHVETKWCESIAAAIRTKRRR